MRKLAKDGPASRPWTMERERGGEKRRGGSGWGRARNFAGIVWEEIQGEMKEKINPRLVETLVRTIVS